MDRRFIAKKEFNLNRFIIYKKILLSGKTFSNKTN